MSSSTVPVSRRDYDVLIVGAGHAGANVAMALRQGGFSGSLALLGAEPELPYERPPLSKDYLSGERAFERLLVRPATYWEEQGVTLLSGCRVLQVDAAGHGVTTAEGERLGYGSLVWAAGAAARGLACDGGDLAGVHAIRTRADVDRLLAELPGVRHATVIGAGYIGLEAAAVLTKLGKQVTVLELEERVLARVAGQALSRFYEAEHRAQGVDLRLGVTVEGLEGVAGRVRGVRLSDGQVLSTDVVIVGIGVTPLVQPLLQVGATGGDGVDVDAHCRTGLPDVFAAGDCAAQSRWHADGRRLRIESVHNAKEQATTVAKVLLGEDAPAQAVPWFWSNQYDLRLQTAGLMHGHDEVVMRGDPATRSFSVAYLREGRVVALDCVNRTQDFVQGKLLVAAGTEVARALLADGDVPLKSLLPG